LGLFYNCCLEASFLFASSSALARAPPPAKSPLSRQTLKSLSPFAFNFTLSTEDWRRLLGGNSSAFFSQIVSWLCSAPTGQHLGKINGSAVHHDTLVQILRCSNVSLILRNLAHLLSFLSANQAIRLHTQCTHSVSIDTC